MTNLNYEECHAKFDTTLEPMTNMELIGLQAMVKESKEKSDMQFFKAIQWELKMRTQKRGKYAEAQTVRTKKSEGIK